MQRFLLRRLLLTIVTLWLVSVLIFFMARISGDPTTLLIDDYASASTLEELRASLGLDKSYPEQYWIFLKNAVQGDFGVSIVQKQPVGSLIMQRLPATLYLGLVAFAFSLVVGIPLGVLSSLKRGSIMDQVGKSRCPHRAVGPALLDRHHADVFLRGTAGVGCTLGAGGDEQHHSAGHNPGVVQRGGQPAADAVGHAGRDGYGIHQAGPGQGGEPEHHHLEACPAQRPDSAPDLCRHYPGRPDYRLPGGRNSICLARIGPAGLPGGDGTRITRCCRA